MNRKLAFFIYSWGSTFIFIFVIFWLAKVPYIAEQTSELSEFYKALYRITLYYILFLLFYRSALISLRNSVSRLSKWHSKQEKNDDTEFVFIIETLLVVLAILASIIVAFIEEIIQLDVAGRNFEVKDILISVMAIMCSATITYSMPVVGELEIWLKEKFFK